VTNAHATMKLLTMNNEHLSRTYRIGSHQHYAKAVPYLPRLACNHICKVGERNHRSCSSTQQRETLPMQKLRIESWKVLERDKCVIIEGAGDLWPLMVSSNTHAGRILTRYT